MQRVPWRASGGGVLEARLAHPPRNVIPARLHPPHFEQWIVRADGPERGGDLTGDPSGGCAGGGLIFPDGVAASTAELPRRRTSELAALPWSEEPTLHIERRAAVDGDQTSVSLAFAGIAETGTGYVAVRAAQSADHAEFPAGHAYRGAARRPHRRRLRGCLDLRCAVQDGTVNFTVLRAALISMQTVQMARMAWLHSGGQGG
ncbi:MAG: hypothetical protein R3F36_08270 [Candidatus Competibacteraceae bacterium]